MNNNDYPFAVRTRMHLYNKCGATGEEAASHTGPDAVLIRWRDEWPPINEVPLAGETVYLRGKPLTVISGIPWRLVHSDEWRLDVVYPKGTMTHASISDLTRTPPVEKVTGVKVGTLDVSQEPDGLRYASSRDGFQGIPPGTYDIVRVDDE